MISFNIIWFIKLYSAVNLNMKGKSIDKKKPTPVILVEEAEEDLTSTLLIGQMIKGGK